MEPRIQYAKTSDGVSIAYAVFGDGPAIVFPSTIWGNVHGYITGSSVVGGTTTPWPRWDGLSSRMTAAVRVIPTAASPTSLLKRGCATLRR